jgi:Fe-S cluster assembly scaffold protein SufB
MTAPAARPRPARRALDDLSLPVDAAAVEAAGAGDPGWLVADRRAAFAAWQALPGESNQLYTPYIDLRAAQLAEATFVPGATGEPGVASLDPGEDAVIETADDGSVRIALSAAARAAGVTVSPLRAAADDLRGRLDGGATLPDDDKFAQLTRALWAHGAAIDVPAGVRLERPIVVRWVVGTDGRALVTRTLVHVGAGAEAAIVEELTPVAAATGATGATGATAQAFFAGTSELSLDAGATLRMASLQELPDHVVAIQHRRAEIGEDATVQWAMAQLGGRLVRSRVDNRLVGDRSSVEQVEIVFGSDAQVFDLTSYTTHIGRDTTGDLLSKGALLESARAAFKGLITIDKTAVGTDSFLGEFGMNLSKQARSVAIPSLEIDQPDCRRAMHSSSVGPVDEAQLFYLESRGIPRDEARKFIVLGFLEPVVARVPLTAAQDHLRDLLEAKWAAGTDGVAGEAAA